MLPDIVRNFDFVGTLMRTHIVFNFVQIVSTMFTDLYEI